MPKEKKGWVAQRARDGRWYARIKGTNPDGTKYDKTKFGTDKAHAEWLLQTLVLSQEGSPQSNVSGSVQSDTTITLKGEASAFLFACGQVLLQTMGRVPSTAASAPALVAQLSSRTGENDEAL